MCHNSLHNLLTYLELVRPVPSRSIGQQVVSIWHYLWQPLSHHSGPHPSLPNLSSMCVLPCPFWSSNSLPPSVKPSWRGWSSWVYGCCLELFRQTLLYQWWWQSIETDEIQIEFSVYCVLKRWRNHAMIKQCFFVIVLVKLCLFHHIGYFD